MEQTFSCDEQTPCSFEIGEALYGGCTYYARMWIADEWDNWSESPSNMVVFTSGTVKNTNVAPPPVVPATGPSDPRVVTAVAGGRYEDKSSGIVITVPPGALPCDGYFDISFPAGVSLPRLALPYVWVYGQNTACDIVLRRPDGTAVSDNMKEPVSLTLSLGAAWAGTAPALLSDTTIRLYQVPEAGQSPGNVETSRGLRPVNAKHVSGAPAGNVTADISALGRFALAGFNAPEAALADLSCYPSPFDPTSRSVTIQYYLINESAVDIAIYDLMGNPVKVWEIAAGDSGARAGLNQVPWDGRNGQGTIVANGGYIVSVSGNGKTKRFKLLVIK